MSLFLVLIFYVIDTPRVQVTPQNLIVMRNTPFNLTCAESSNPARTSLVWKSGSSEIASQVTVHSVGSGISEDTTYTCDVRSSLGSGEGSTRVTVHCKFIYRMKHFI